MLVVPSSSSAASGPWDRAWGRDVFSGGGLGFEVCTSAASCKAGLIGSGGEMLSPEGIATDASGNVYVADFNNHRIQKFDSDGNWERAWGRDVDGVAAGTGFEVCTVAANCQAGTAGGLGGEMSFPAAVAADDSGNVYVADTDNRRIQKFDSDGNFERAWGKDVDGVAAGTGFEICTAAANCQLGTFGGLGGEMGSPGGVAVDGSGNVYVADTSNRRIQRFDSDGNFGRAWGKDVDGVAAGTGFEICAVAASCQIGAVGDLGGEMNAPVAVAADASGNVYLADRDNNRIQKFADPPSAPPPPPQPPAQGSAAPPSNAFSFGRLKRNTKKGTAFLFVNLPGPGEVGLRGKG